MYIERGMDPEQARLIADQLMADPEVALEVHAREELGFAPGNLASPWTASFSSFIAFAVGAFVSVPRASALVLLY